MEKVADRMKGLKLSVSEQKEVKIGWTDGKKVGMVEHQAMAKLMAEKPAFAEAMEAALGRILCPMKGLEVKDLGENIFLFTFHQESGKKRALSEGPWSFAKSLLVFEDYDPDKTLKVGEFMAADVGANGMAIGKYLRIKDMLMTIFHTEEQQRMQILAMMWQWWTTRNKRNAKDGPRSVLEVAAQSRRWAGEFVMYLTKPRGSSIHANGVDQWERPVTEVLKISTDGAFSENPRRGRWGFVIRDSAGVVAGLGAGKKAFLMDAVHTEAEACIQGLTTAMNWGMTRVVVETDSKVLVDALNKED
ncbi:putative caffeine synthase 2 [Hordeum vulgare]|nr:putative caffeine synthase 2 [Hordeum vulgare]